MSKDHSKVIKLLEKRKNPNNPEDQSQSTDGKSDKLIVGKKRLHSIAFNALRKGEIENSVELAYLQRPYSPKNFRIYSDK